MAKNKFTPKTLYSRFKAGITATQLALPDHHGFSPAFINDPDHDDYGEFAGVINLLEWSEAPTVTIPDGFPRIWYVVSFSDRKPKATTDETEAKHWVKNEKGAIGYASATVQDAVFITA